MSQAHPRGESFDAGARGAVGGAFAAALRRVHEVGRAAHPGVDLAYDVFAARAAALVGARASAAGGGGGDEERAALLSRCAGADLYLAVACEAGVAGAWERLQADLRPRLEGLARRRGLGAGEAETVAADVLGDLALPVSWATSRTLVGTFDGTGSLFAWAAVLLVRRLSKAARSPWSLRRVGAAPEEGEAERATWGARPTGAEAAALRETAGRFRAAFEDAWRRLSPTEQAALSFKHRDGLPQREIARVLGVGEAWVSRLVGRATQSLGARVRAAVPPGAARDDEALTAALRDVVQTSWARIGAPIAPPRDGRGTTPRAEG